MKQILKTLIKDFHHNTLPALTLRFLKFPLDLNRIITIIGLLRYHFRNFCLFMTLIPKTPILQKNHQLFYKKELIFDRVTNAFSMFVRIFDSLRLRGAVQLGLMAVIGTGLT